MAFGPRSGRAFLLTLPRSGGTIGGIRIRDIRGRFGGIYEKTFVSAFALVVFSSSFSGLQAQVATGNIIGRITDKTGAVVPGVTVTSLDPAKGLKSETVSDDQGMYRLLYLGPADVFADLHCARVSPPCSGPV